MPDIMVRCPTVGAVVPTGVTTEVVKFECIAAEEAKRSTIRNEDAVSAR
jgi:hypothetical protein